MQRTEDAGSSVHMPLINWVALDQITLHKIRLGHLCSCWEHSASTMNLHRILFGLFFLPLPRLYYSCRAHLGKFAFKTAFDGLFFKNREVSIRGCDGWYYPQVLAFLNELRNAHQIDTKAKLIICAFFSYSPFSRKVVSSLLVTIGILICLPGLELIPNLLATGHLYPGSLIR